MNFALTTRWNASRHSSGESLVEEILELGISRLELGYDTRMDLVPGLLAMQEQGVVQIDSVHNYCPVPLGVSKGHPELWTFCAKDKRIQELAVQHTARTIQFAAEEAGAKVVVVHCGYVAMKRQSSRDLMGIIQLQGRYAPHYEKNFMKFLAEREKRVSKHLDALSRCIERLLPVCEQYKVQLGLENLPTYEAVPNEIEMEQLLQRFPSPWLKYWHDLGHGQIRENMGFINHERWLERLAPHTAGMHIHDVARTIIDHVMPPAGDRGLKDFRRFAEMEDMLLVLEPNSQASAGDIKGALEYLQTTWVAEQDREEEERNT